jgi:hypothetical protein
MKGLEKIILDTLSFQEDRSLQQILLEMNEDKLLKLPPYTMEDLDNSLEKLVREKKIELKETPYGKTWRRKMGSFSLTRLLN